ncbi:uncharacterized protein [Dendrobates tinctorius]|uniref:uncharacterized protein n=1 Tax=Dendrobates tinctorius TaxID=92724 RepID=UPI003CC9BD9F
MHLCCPSLYHWGFAVSCQCISQGLFTMNFENPPPYTGVNQPGPYPAYGQQQGVPPQYPGYPPVPAGYQPGQPGYHPGQPEYQPGYHPGQPEYQPGYQPGQPGYQPGYQPGQPGYQPGYQPGQSGYQPGYQPGQPDYQGYPQYGGQPPAPGYMEPPKNTVRSSGGTALGLRAELSIRVWGEGRCSLLGLIHLHFHSYNKEKGSDSLPVGYWQLLSLGLETCGESKNDGPIKNHETDV